MLFDFRQWDAFLQEEFADTSLVLLAPPTSAEANEQSRNAPPVEIRQLPAHTVILANSPYFKAQVIDAPVI